MSRLGIDFGTCFSSAALPLGQHILLVKDDDAPALGYSFPSSAYVEENTGEVLVGRAADYQRMANPGQYRNRFKRELASLEPYVMGQHKLRAVHLVTEMLRHLKKQADQMLESRGQPAVTGAVLTVPAKAMDLARDLMQLAAGDAGFRQVNLLDEPMAAAIFYARQVQMREGEIVLVYDLGGGTFDTALLQKTSTDIGYQFLAIPDGLDPCGGIDFDHAVYQDVARSHRGLGDLLLSDRHDKAAWITRLKVAEDCIHLKHQLSKVQQSEFPVTLPSNGEVVHYRLTRSVFNEMIAPFIRQTMECCRRMVRSANLAWEKIDRILLMGGSCRIPYVQEVLKQEFQRPITQMPDLELVICQGAALFGMQNLPPLVPVPDSLRVQYECPYRPVKRPESPPEPKQRSQPQSAPTTHPRSQEEGALTKRIREARPGETIKLTPGTYRESLMLDQSIHIEGDGPGKDIILESVGAPCLSVRNGEVTVRGLTFRRLATPDGRANDEEAVLLVRQGTLKLQECAITSASGDGLVVAGAGASAELCDCQIHDTKGRGILFTEQARGTIERCKIYSSGLAGIQIKTGANPRILSCLITNGNQAGILVNEGGLGKLEFCIVVANGRAGVEIRSGANPTLYSCGIHHGNGNGVLIHSKGQGVLAGCQIYSNALAGLEITDNATPTIRDCKIYNGKAGGVFIHDQGSGTLENNDIYGNALAGIQIKTGGNPVISKCQIHDNREVGILVTEQGRGTIERCHISVNAFAGVEIRNEGNPLIRACRIRQGGQAGVFVHNYGQGTIEDCEIGGNAFDGVEIVTGGNPTIRRCTIRANNLAGIHIHQRGRGVLEKNSLSDNGKGNLEVEPAA